MAYQFKREPLNSDEITLLEAACQSPFERLVIWTLLDTGLRVGELAALSSQDVDWQRDSMVIWGKGSKGKGKKRRVVPFTARVRSALRAHFEIEDKIGKSVRMIEYIVKEVAGRSGIKKKVTPHVLRHTFAVRVVARGKNGEAGLDLVSLMHILGHEYLSTTQIYLNISNEQAIQAYRERLK